MAERTARLHHLVWHLSRNGWYKIKDNDVRDKIESLGWKPPRPSMIQSEWDPRNASRRGNARWAIHTGAGEDFLFFHRVMIARANQLLKDEGKQPLVSWSDQDHIPAPGEGCPDETVPPAWEIPGAPVLSRRLAQIKSDSFFYSNMLWWEQEFADFANLRRLTLGELGARLELGVHNHMHMRWAAMPWHPALLAPSPYLRAENDIRPMWDVPEYDTLIDEYSAHVNPLFWRLHVWVDNRIRDWAEAHDGDLKERLVDGVVWYEPGEWVSVDKPWMGAFDLGHATRRQIRRMEKVVELMPDPVSIPDLIVGNNL